MCIIISRSSFFVVCFTTFDMILKYMILTKGVFKGWGVQGVQTPPKFSDFFLKSERKEVERKRKKMRRDGGGGGELMANIFLGSPIFLNGVQIFSGGVEKFLGVEKFSGGGLRNFQVG